jgi:hypothetical protein
MRIVAMKKLLCLIAVSSVLSGCASSSMTSSVRSSVMAGTASAKEAQAIAIIKADLWACKTDEWTSSTWKAAYHDRYDSRFTDGLAINGFPIRLLSHGDFEFFVPFDVRGVIIDLEGADESAQRVINALTKSQPAAMHSSLSQGYISAPRSQADFVNVIGVNETR